MCYRKQAGFCFVLSQQGPEICDVISAKRSHSVTFPLQRISAIPSIANDQMTLNVLLDLDLVLIEQLPLHALIDPQNAPNEETPRGVQGHALR